jgi:hypothetical protein
VRVDGEAVTFGLRADYLVARAGRRYIAEVKTGLLAPRLSHGPTRRQLLEYSAAFEVDGVVLVDADRASIAHVEVPRLGTHARRGLRLGAGAAALLALLLFSAGLAAGVAFAAVIYGTQWNGLPVPRPVHAPAAQPAQFAH